MEYIQLIGGLIILVVSGNYLVDSAADIARKFKLSSLIIGMTIVAFGTSAPELFVSVQAAVKGHPEIAMGNVIGSNIANIGLIMAITALILPVFASPRSIKVDWSFLMFVSVLIAVLTWDGNFSRLDGLISLVLLIVFTVWSIRSSKKNQSSEDVIEKPRKSVWINSLIFIVSCAGLALGADLLVKGATTLAYTLGISERVVSVVIVAVGTSLPELTASIIAAIKREHGITLGNIIGSNIFNILCVLGITGIIKPISFSPTEFQADIIWMLFFTILLFIGMLNITENHKKYAETKDFRQLFSSQEGLIGRIWGICILGVYIYYVISLFMK